MKFELLVSIASCLNFVFSAFPYLGNYSNLVSLSDTKVLVLTNEDGIIITEDNLIKKSIPLTHRTDKNSCLLTLNNYVILVKGTSSELKLYLMDFDLTTFSDPVSSPEESEGSYNYAIIDQLTFIVFWSNSTVYSIRKFYFDGNGNIIKGSQSVDRTCDNCKSINCDYWPEVANPRIICVESPSTSLLFALYSLDLSPIIKLDKTLTGSNPRIKYIKADIFLFCRYILDDIGNHVKFQCQSIKAQREDLNFINSRIVSWDISYLNENNYNLIIGKTSSLFILHKNKLNEYELNQFTQDMVPLGLPDKNPSKDSALNVKLFSINTNIIGYVYEEGDKVHMKMITYPECPVDSKIFARINSMQRLKFLLKDNSPPAKISFYKEQRYSLIQYDKQFIKINQAYDYYSEETGGKYFDLIPLGEIKEESTVYYAVKENLATSLCSLTIVICYSTCASCQSINPGNENDHQCESCIKELFPQGQAKPFNCLSPDNKGYFKTSDPEGIEYLEQCYQTCETCEKAGSNDIHNCKTCKPDLVGLSEGENPTIINCVKGEIKGYYFDPLTRLYQKCHENCGTCTTKGTPTMNNCLTCKTDFDLYSFFPYHCFKKCKNEEKWYFDEINQTKICGTTLCPQDNPYYETKQKQCVKGCLYKKDTHCLTCSNTILYENLDDKTCIEKCNKGTEIDHDAFTCKTPLNPIPPTVQVKQKIFDSKQEETISYEQHSSKPDLIESYLSLVLEKDLTRSTQIDLVYFYEGNDFSLTYFRLLDEYEVNTQVYKAKKVSSIDFTSIKSALNNMTTKSKIEPNDVFVMQWDINRSDPTHQVDYRFYVSTDLILYSPLTFSFEISNITISSPIQNREESTIQRAYFLSQRGIDIFNKSSPFYNDICFKFNESGKDVSIIDRRSNYYPNTSLCDSNCIMSKIDWDNWVVHCNCPFSNFTVGIRKNPRLDRNFSQGYFETYNVVTCPSQVFNSESLRTNVGFWLFLSFCLIFIVLMFCFIANGLSYASTYVKEVLKNKSQTKQTEDKHIDEDDELEEIA